MPRPVTIVSVADMPLIEQSIGREGQIFAMTFPVASGVYNTASWNAGCPTAGICGNASDPAGGLYLTDFEVRGVKAK